MQRVFEKFMGFFLVQCLTVSATRNELFLAAEVTQRIQFGTS